MADWKIERSTSAERIFRKINEELTGPLAVVVFGTDAPLKDEVWRAFDKRLEKCRSFYNPNDDDLNSPGPIERALNAGEHVLLRLSAKRSVSHEARHTVVQKLYGCGAVTVVGVYAKPDPDGYDYDACPALADQVVRLAAEPPTSDGLDYLVTVTGP